MIRDERRTSIIAVCKDCMITSVNAHEMRTRMDCLHYVMGYLRSAEIDSIPIDLIQDIDKLYYDGVLTA